MAVAAGQRDDHAQEESPLLGACATSDGAGTDSAAAAVAQQQVSEQQAMLRQASSSKDSIVICRICLEDDAASALEVPCACSGTQRYAHHDCIQKWVTEKGNARCEICEQPYRGDYVVPPPPPAGIPIETLSAYLLDPGDPRMVNSHGRPGAPAFPELYVDNDMDMYNRSPGVSWCLTVVLFFLIMLALHHSLLVADGVDGSSYDAGTAGGDLPGGPPGSSGAPEDPYNPDNSPGLFTIIIFLAFKAFLVAVPLYTIMRVAAGQAQREARREQLEALVRGAAAYEAARYNSRQLLLAARAAASSQQHQQQLHQQQTQQSLPPPDQAPAPAGAPVRSHSQPAPEALPAASTSEPGPSGAGSSSSSSSSSSSTSTSSAAGSSIDPSSSSSSSRSPVERRDASSASSHVVVHVGPAEPAHPARRGGGQVSQDPLGAAEAPAQGTGLPSIPPGPDAV